MKIIGKKIVVTGGTSGIGRCLVDKLAGDNHVIAVSRNAEKLDELVRHYPAYSIKTYQCDLSNLDQVERTCSDISRDNPRLDLLINNAAIQYTPGFLSDHFNQRTIKDEITTNFTSICYLIHGLLPSLLDDKRSSIILNVNSALGFYPKTSSAVYCATKGALNILSQSLSYQFEKTNIQVLQAILPLVETPMTEGRGRSKGKISAEKAADALIMGLKKEIPEHYIGKSKLLKIIGRISPGVARNILKGG